MAAQVQHPAGDRDVASGGKQVVVGEKQCARINDRAAGVGVTVGLVHVSVPPPSLTRPTSPAMELE